MLISILFGFLCYFLRVLIKHKEKIMRQIRQMGSPDKPGGLSIQLCKSEKKEFYIRYSS